MSEIPENNCQTVLDNNEFDGLCGNTPSYESRRFILDACIGFIFLAGFTSVSVYKKLLHWPEKCKKKISKRSPQYIHR